MLRAVFKSAGYSNSTTRFLLTFENWSRTIARIRLTFGNDYKSKNQNENCNYRRWRKSKPSSTTRMGFFKLCSTGGVSMGLLGFFESKEETLEEKVLILLKRSILAIQRGELDHAEEHLVNALRISHENKMEDVKTQIFDMQANLALQKQELDRAETLFKAVAQRLVQDQECSTTDNAIVEISLKLAQIYAAKGQFKEAILGYEYCIETQQLKIESENGEDDEDTLLLAAWAMHSLAQLRLTFGMKASFEKAQIEETVKLINGAYKYAVKAAGTDSEQAISIQSDLASTLALSGDFDGALAKLNEVETIAREKYASLYPHIRVNIGNVYLQKGAFVEAEKVCVDARSFAKNVKNMEAFARAEECMLASVKARQAQSEPA